MTKTPVLYHCPQTRGVTTHWMNEELGAPCEISLVDIKKADHKKPDYLKLNPMGKIPTLVHEGVAVTEAAAICAYLADAFADKGLAPSLDDPKRGAYYRLMFFAPSCIEPAMLDKFSGTVRENPSSAGHGSVEDVLGAIDQALETGPYLLGEKFSAADVIFGSTLNFALMFGAFDKKPLYTEYVDRLLARPAAKRSHEKNEAYANDLGWE
ncbi:MAG: glutathione S-transferase [Hyphococcus sp.]|nr:MAG: glutathione S-transferase [Marinicaulis sp.]